jgi:hypothetical protein
MLLNRLQGFALEQNDPQTRKTIEMSSDRVRAAIALLRKTMPDLAVTTLIGDANHPVAHTFRWATAPQPPEPTVIESEPEHDAG